MNAYHSCLRQLVSTCEFAKIDKEIKQQIIQSCSSQRLRYTASMSPDPAKIEAIQKADPLSSVNDVRSLLGITNYVSRFIRNYTDIVSPLT